MPSVTAPSPWHSPASPSVAFGRQVLDAVGPGGGTTVRWLLRRNCSISPRQMAGFYASLCLVSLLIGAFFLVQGTAWVLLFAGLELLAVGAALLVFARHVADRELLTLAGGRLQVEQRFGNWVQCTDWPADRLTVEPSGAQGSLVKLCSRGRTLLVGRFVRPELRAAFAQELRVALRHRPAGSVGE